MGRFLDTTIDVDYYIMHFTYILVQLLVIVVSANGAPNLHIIVICMFIGNPFTNIQVLLVVCFEWYFEW